MFVEKVNRVSHLAGDIATALSHGDADVCALQRGRVVHAVTSHGDELAVGAQGFDELQLVRGAHAREDVRGPRG